MSNEQIVQEIQAGNNVNENLALLYQQNLPFIRKVVRIFTKNEEDMEDLLQESFFAIEKAAYRYDTEQRDANFLTYASYYIRSHCGNYMQKSRSVYIPSDGLKKVLTCFRLRKEYMLEHGKEPTEEYIIKQMGVNKRQYSRLLNMMLTTYVHSLEENVGSDEDALTIGETLPSEIHIEEDCLKDDLNKRVWMQVKKLNNPRLTYIIEGIFREGKTQHQIAEEMSVSSARVQQLQSKAFSILKKTSDIQEAAQYYGYDCGIAYNYTMARFKHTHTSSVEHIALKHLHISELLDKYDKKYKGVISDV